MQNQSSRIDAITQPLKSAIYDLMHELIDTGILTPEQVPYHPVIRRFLKTLYAINGGIVPIYILNCTPAESPSGEWAFNGIPVKANHHCYYYFDAQTWDIVQVEER